MRSKKILAIPAVAVVFIAWFLVASRDAAMTSFVDAKVKTALEIGRPDVALSTSSTTPACGGAGRA